MGEIDEPNLDQMDKDFEEEETNMNT